MNPYIKNVSNIFKELPDNSYARKPLDTYIRLMNNYKEISNKDSDIIQYALAFCTNLKVFLNEYVKQTYPQYNINIEIKGRIKSPVSALTKFRSSINEYMENENDLDKLIIKDLFAFRVIVTVMDKSFTILSDNIAIPICYDVVKEAFKYSENYKYINIIDSKPRSDKNAPIVFNDLVVPYTRPDFIKENENKIKDYIYYPKRTSNYQSAHIKLKLVLPNNKELYFEMQTRTYAMNEHAEHGPASHLTYKNRNIVSFSRVPQIFESGDSGNLEFVQMNSAFKEFYGISISDINPELSFEFLEDFLKTTNYNLPLGILKIQRDYNGFPTVSKYGKISKSPVEVMRKNKNNSPTQTIDALVLDIFSHEKEFDEL